MDNINEAVKQLAEFGRVISDHNKRLGKYELAYSQAAKELDKELCEELRDRIHIEIDQLLDHQYLLSIHISKLNGLA